MSTTVCRSSISDDSRIDAPLSEEKRTAMIDLDKSMKSDIKASISRLIEILPPVFIDPWDGLSSQRKYRLLKR